MDKFAYELGKSAACWSGYEQVGMKNKGGREVPNCVPKDSDGDPKPMKKKKKKT